MGLGIAPPYYYLRKGLKALFDLLVRITAIDFATKVRDSIMLIGY
jgi:hypothetical protein